MLHLYDRATMARALTLDLEPQLRRLLGQRIEVLDEELLDYTEYLVVEAGDGEDDIVRAIGFSPLVDPISGVRFGEPGFEPGFDFLADRDGWWEMIVTFGSSFAYVLLLEDGKGMSCSLRRLCRAYAPT